MINRKNGVIVSVVLGATFFLCGIIYLAYLETSNLKIERRSALGQYVGSILGSAATGAATFFFLAALLQQSRDLSIQQNTLSAQLDELSLQRQQLELQISELAKANEIHEDQKRAFEDQNALSRFFAILPHVTKQKDEIGEGWTEVAEKMLRCVGDVEQKKKNSQYLKNQKGNLEVNLVKSQEDGAKLEEKLRKLKELQGLAQHLIGHSSLSVTIKTGLSEILRASAGGDSEADYRSVTHACEQVRECLQFLNGVNST